MFAKLLIGCLHYALIGFNELLSGSPVESLGFIGMFLLGKSNTAPRIFGGLLNHRASNPNRSKVNGIRQECSSGIPRKPSRKMLVCLSKGLPETVEN